MDRRACWLLVSLCVPALALAGPSEATPGTDDAAVWSWEDAEGGLHYGRWHEIPARQRRRARRVDATVGTVGAGEPAPSEPAPPAASGAFAAEPRSDAPPCARLASLRQPPPERGWVVLRSGIREQLDEAHYVVDGDTPEQVRRSLDARRPFAWDGYTAWRVTWDFGREPASPACRLPAPSVALHVTITTPRLGDPPRRDGTLARRWEAYLAALSRHEAGHRDLAAAAANDVLEALSGFTGAPCSTGAAARACALGILEEYKRLQREYDAATRHGATEGARFP